MNLFFCDDYNEVSEWTLLCLCLAKVHVRAKKTVDVLTDITGMLSLELHFYPREVSVGSDVNLQLTAPEHPYVFWLLDTGKIRTNSL